MAKKTDFTYEDGDFVVYPTHGVGRILGTETRTVAGTDMTLLVIRFEQDRMTLRVPMEKAISLGLRTLSSSKQMVTLLKLPKLSGICAKKIPPQSSLIQSVKCIKLRSSDWHANMQQSRILIRILLRLSSKKLWMRPSF